MPLMINVDYRHFRRLVVVALASCLFASLGRAAAEDSEGAKIYEASCAKCHGARGEGTKKYAQRLEGELSVAELAEVIRKTMPEDRPNTLSPLAARTVAGYVHDAFYSPVARERNRPARIELSRLTVKQYRQSVADLVGSFRTQLKWSEERGLRGEYFSGRRISTRTRVMERIDPQVSFDFGTDAPTPDKIEPHEFSIRWNGSVIANHSGEYQFVIRTEHAARLWVNDLIKPIIDAWVKSGSDTEYKANLYLIAGRAYPLRLEFSKAKQGVDDSKNQKSKPPSAQASIVLLWRQPAGVLEPIPARSLTPQQGPEIWVCSAPFPPDDRSAGWERATSISKEWYAAVTEANLETAAYVAAHVDELAGVGQADRSPRPASGDPSAISFDNKIAPVASPERTRKLQAFAKRFVEQAHRKPLSEEKARAIELQFGPDKDPDVAVKRVVLLALQSPHFLFREFNVRPDGYDVAARLAFGLWDSIPDQELLRAAQAGELQTPEQARKQAERMLDDPRARTKLRDMVLSWTKADHGLDLSKDPKRFPGFDEQVVADLRTSLELQVEEVINSSDADFRRLFLADKVFINGRLAKYYGVDLEENSGFTPVSLDSGKRAGVLTHPYLMTSFAHAAESSPIHRGVFLARGMLGVSLRPPTEAVTPLAPDLHPTLTTRERVTLQTQVGNCMSCHGIINPLGFTLEHFDAVGKYRDTDNGKPVDATGSYRNRSGALVKLTGSRQLGEYLAGSDEAHAAFVEQLCHYLTQQPIRAFGPKTANQLRLAFARENFNIRKLAVEVMAATALASREQQAAETSPRYH